jgi:hypothetical protein
MAYKPIDSYGVIGDLHTVALVNMDGVVRSVRGGGALPARMPTCFRLRAKAVGDPRKVVNDQEARYFGGRVEERSLVPLGEARLGRIGFDEWLRRSQARA